MRAERRMTLVNVWGMHARTAMLFVRRARAFAAAVTVAKNGEAVDGKEVMSLLTLCAGPGDEIVVTAEGSDAEEAADALLALVAGGFGEERIGSHQ